jgi:hypothetical protein
MVTSIEAPFETLTARRYTIWRRIVERSRSGLRENAAVRRAFVVLLAAILASAVSAGVASASKVTVLFFRTPSGNIACNYASGFDRIPAYVRCDVASGLHDPTPRRPKNCDLEYGDSIGMSKRGRPGLTCHGDTVRDRHARVIAYGHTWRHDGFTCLSQAIGLRCTNLSRHGFFLSRERWYTF